MYNKSMDTVSKEQRHLNMSHIKGKNTSLELKVRKDYIMMDTDIGLMYSIFLESQI